MLCNQKVIYWSYRNPPLGPIAIHFSKFYFCTFYLPKAHFNILSSPPATTKGLVLNYLCNSSFFSVCLVQLSILYYPECLFAVRVCAFSSVYETLVASVSLTWYVAPTIPSIEEITQTLLYRSVLNPIKTFTDKSDLFERWQQNVCIVGSAISLWTASFGLYIRTKS